LEGILCAEFAGAFGDCRVVRLKSEEHIKIHTFQLQIVHQSLFLASRDSHALSRGAVGGCDIVDGVRVVQIGRLAFCR
jgi:hypothetical protein